MDEKTIIKNAILIADFEGYVAIDNGSYGNIFYSENNERTAVDTYYHCSWDWLMPVVEKCLSSYEINDKHYNDIHDALWSINIKETYKSVINFIIYKNNKDEK